MNRVILKILISSLIVISCEDESSRELDYVFKSNFQNCINIMILRQAGYSIDYENTVKAYLCLEHLTNVESKIDKGSDTPLFYPPGDGMNLFISDVKGWSEWYEKNKGWMTMPAADSIFKVNSDREMIITWPESVLTIMATINIPSEPPPSSYP